MSEKLNDLDKKLELLECIPTYRLRKLAEDNGIAKSGNIQELKKRIAENVNFLIIEEIFEEYEDAGNISIFLFEYNKNNLLDLNQRTKLQALLKKHGIEHLFESKLKIKVTSIPKLVFIGYANKDKNKIKIRLEFKDKEIKTRDADTRRLIKFSPLISTIVIIHLDGLVEVRIRKRRFAEQTCKKISEYFNNGHYESVIFNEADIEKIINWAKIFRNAIIKPLSGDISSLRMTARTDSDLRKVELYTNRERIIGESIKTGVYLKFDIKSNKKIRTIGFQINLYQGKIFFKTTVNEKEIDHVLSKIKEIKGF